MEASKSRKIKSGEEFDHLFPKPIFLDSTIKKGASVYDTVRFIPQVVSETLFHTEKLAPILKGKSVYETCQNIWDFVYNHIAYQKDEEGKEQIRSPARAWHDRNNGIDCDCYTVFISSILSNLKIKHKLRITKYKHDHFQHIYPIVPTSDGNYITVDCVVDRFNYEEPYSEKQDTIMELQYLNGIPGANNVDVQDLMGWQELEGEDLGKIKLFKKPLANAGGVKKIFQKISSPPQNNGTKKITSLKAGIQKVVHATNRVNPATALIRTGVLVSMKLNLFKVAQRLKFAYLSEEQAKQKEMDMGKFSQLKKVKEKLEKIFYEAGGKPENLKEAILTGKGNKNKEVNGLGNTYEFNEHTPANILLGEKLFYDENLDGLGELGSATAAAASITAASGIVGAIAGLLKGIGNIFPKKSKEGKDFENTESQSGDGTSAEEVAQGASTEKVTDNASNESVNNSTGNEEESGNGNPSKPIMKNSTTSVSTTSSSNETATENKALGFWDKNKKWIKPTAIGITGIGLLYLGYNIMKPKETPKPSTLSGQLNGLKSRKKKKGGEKGKEKKQAVAYL